MAVKLPNTETPIQLVAYSVWWRITYLILMCIILFFCILIWGQGSDIMGQHRLIIHYFKQRLDNVETRLNDLERRTSEDGQPSPQPLRTPAF